MRLSSVRGVSNVLGLSYRSNPTYMLGVQTSLDTVQCVYACAPFDFASIQLQYIKFTFVL